VSQWVDRGKTLKKTNASNLSVVFWLSKDATFSSRENLVLSTGYNA